MFIFVIENLCHHMGFSIGLPKEDKAASISFPCCAWIFSWIALMSFLVNEKYK